jgi:hypothetical protein
MEEKAPDIEIYDELCGNVPADFSFDVGRADNRQRRHQQPAVGQRRP